jgi:sugar transferase (PEP-CTERM/EpsH1 system associated)
MHPLNELESMTGKRKITIMHVIYSLDIGGLENGLVNLINRMDQSKFSHSICCIGQSGRYAKRLNGQDVEIFEMKKGEGSDLLLSMKLARVFKSIQTDIVHTRNWGAIDGIIGAKLARIPHVIHGEHGRDMTDPDGSNKKRKFIRKGLSYFVDRYITVSGDFREWLITDIGIDDRKVQTICNGVDTAKFNPDNKDLVRAKHGYSREDLIIGTVGRLDPIKDQQLLIRSFAQVAMKYPRLHLLIIGDGPCREDLERLAKDLGVSNNVLFSGMRHDVPELLKLLDIFVLPSLFEGISNTILEAMATGIPVVATRVGGNPELVVDGETGYLAPKQDIDALAKALENYILSPLILKQHGAAARERAVREFGLDRMVAQYEELYTRLLMRNK